MSSVCNDVVGDICGIVSGTTAAVIVIRLQTALDMRSVLVSVAVTALISGLTIGGKALGKTFAIQQQHPAWSIGRGGFCTCSTAERRLCTLILETIHSPADVKALDRELSCRSCAGELREFLIQHVSKTGGHLASNLGAVELTVAIHRVFDTAVRPAGL